MGISCRGVSAEEGPSFQTTRTPQALSGPKDEMTQSNTSRSPTSPQKIQRTGRQPRRRGFLACLAAAACLVGTPTVHAHPPASRPANSRQVRQGNIEIYATRADGSHLGSFEHGGQFYLAGEQGERYELHLRNRSSSRMEVVVSVDGRDVLTGEEADYTVHRGYIVPAWGTVTIPGFRRSMDHVAAFRFSAPDRAYSSRLGTPQHVGVIGVAAFRERTVRRRPRPTPRVVAPEAEGHHHHRKHKRSRGADMEELQLDDGPTSGSSMPAARPSGSRGAAGHAHEGMVEEDAVSPARRRRAGPRQLGTQWGEDLHDQVREARFRRRNFRRPDVLLRLDYDSMDGLRARGVIERPRPHVHTPDPFPGRNFAEPPPGRW